MFGKTEQGEAAAVEDRSGKKVELAAVHGTAAAAVVGRTVKVVYASFPGAPVRASVYPLPAFGKVVDVSPLGPSVVMANGDLRSWKKGRFQLVANLLDAEVNP